ncbi:MAG: methyl-accepting chemotaxis protein [Methanosarcinaceae archaeon]|nr:methyl-accepting chemotaxis protein [Methanosarcinaceae archaeon]
MNKAQMNDVLEATANYRSAFDTYVQVNNDEAVLSKKLQLEGKTLVQMAEVFHADQLEEYRQYSQDKVSYKLAYREFQEIESSDKLSYDMVKVSNEINEYFITGDQEYVDSFGMLLEGAIEQAGNMSSVSEEEEEIEELTHIIVKLNETQANIQQLIELKKQKAEAEDNMQLAAFHVKEAVKGALEDQNTKVASQVVKSTKTIILVTFFSLLIGALLVIVILKLFRKPVNELLEAADRISNGDLTVEISETSRNEVAQLSRVFRQMVENLRQLIGQIQVGSTRLASMSEEISASSEEMALASKRISDAVTEMSEGSHSQASKIVDVTHAMRDMTQNVQEIADNSQNASRNTNFVNDIMHNLGNNSNEVLIKMDRIKSSVAEASEVIGALDEKSRKINEIVTLITGISDQTNMLALNAAIEAARAGEHGRGFSVVADEVRKLAEESGSSAKEISGLIEEIRSGINAAVECIETSKNEVQDGHLSVSGATKAVTGVVSTINGITNMIEGIAAAAQEQSASIEEITSTIEDISSISEDSASGTAEVAAAVEEQTASLGELADAAHELASFAESMMTTTARFKLDACREDDYPED